MSNADGDANDDASDNADGAVDDACGDADGGVRCDGSFRCVRSEGRGLPFPLFKVVRIAAADPDTFCVRTFPPSVGVGATCRSNGEGTCRSNTLSCYNDDKWTVVVDAEGNSVAEEVAERYPLEGALEPAEYTAVVVGRCQRG